MLPFSTAAVHKLSAALCRLSDHYVYQSAFGDEDYICGHPQDNGMSKCHIASEPENHLPHFKYENGLMRCDADAQAFSANEPTNASCVNWNQYYTNCAALAQNPFLGSISFDNIGLAWVVIFQVRALR